VRADGRLVLYDFGNVIKLTPEFRAKVNNLVFAIYQKDIDEFTDLLLELNIIQLESSLDVLELKAFFNYFFDYLETLNFDELKTAVLNKDIFYNSNIRFKVDPNFLSLFRVFSLMDGTCSALDPEFNYITALAPFSEQLFMDANFINYRARKDLQALSAYPKLLKNTDQNILRVNRRFSKMSESMFDMRFLFITVAIVDNVGDPLRIAILVSLFGYFFWKEDN
jgi:predicted unusual protein kinase regulating ubiquinone biosynthesis (AarF/ABC1/UbiB family)